MHSLMRYSSLVFKILWLTTQKNHAVRSFLKIVHRAVLVVVGSHELIRGPNMGKI